MTRRIIIDLDDVSYSLLDLWIERYNKDYPHHTVSRQDIKSWSLVPFVAPECGVKIYDYLKDKSLYTEGLAIDGATDITKAWQSVGYEVGIATRAMTPEAFAGKAEWLAINMPHIKAVFMLGSDSKWWIDGDVFVDDAPHHLAQVKGVRILYNQPHNQDNNDYVRASNWQEVDALVHLAIAAQNNGMNRDAIEELLKWVVSFGLLGEYVYERNSK